MVVMITPDGYDIPFINWIEFTSIFKIDEVMIESVKCKQEIIVLRQMIAWMWDFVKW